MSIYQNIAMSGLEKYNQIPFQKHPLDGYDITRMPMDELEAMIVLLTREYDRRTMDTPIPGPTKRQLLADETLKTAWEEFQVIRKLKGIK